MDLFRLRSPGRKWMTPSPSISPKDKIGFASNHLPISQGSCLGLLKKGCRVCVTSFCHPLSVLVLDALWMDFNCEFVRIGWHLSPFLARFQWITGSSDGCFLRPKKDKKIQKTQNVPELFFWFLPWFTFEPFFSGEKWRCRKGWFLSGDVLCRNWWTPPQETAVSSLFGTVRFISCPRHFNWLQCQTTSLA